MSEKFNDMTLVARVTMFHDKKAFEQLVRKYQSPVRRFFLNHTMGNEPLSDDLAQETFIKVYTHIDKFRGISGFSTWLYRIAYNVFYDYTRQHRLTEDISSTAARNIESLHSNHDLRMDMYKALKILKEEERTCIILQMIDGQPIDNIASITGMPEGTIKSHLSRGKKQLATYLRNNGYGH